MANKTVSSGPDDPSPAPDREKNPLDTFRKVMSSFIDDFFTSFDLLPLSVFEDAGALVPRVSVTHDQDTLTITAELPGMEASDIEITLGGGTLLIQGGRGEGESTGAAGLDLGPPFFRKMIPIPFSIDVQNATAVFKDRVLKVMLPRLTAEYPARIRIPIKP